MCIISYSELDVKLIVATNTLGTGALRHEELLDEKELIAPQGQTDYQIGGVLGIGRGCSGDWKKGF
jgi:hypothetical protein